MRRENLVEFVSGATALAYVVAGVYFLRFWQKTRDRLFMSFALAFWLLGLNQTIVSLLDVTDERTGYAYILRVVGFLFIFYAIVRKNLARHPGA